MWLDAGDLGWATCVVTDDDQPKAEQLADELADLAWSVRHSLPPELPEAEQAIAQARGARVRRRLGTVCMSDASDMVGAGAPGDNTRLLAALLEHAGGLLTYAPMRDGRVVDDLWEHPLGSPISVTLGAPTSTHRRCRSRVACSTAASPLCSGGCWCSIWAT